MRIPLDRDLTVPLFRQLERYLQEGILTGTLPSGTRLPAARQLAGSLGVSRITVENAYAELELNGLVARRMGSGTYVLAPSQRALPAPDKTPAWPPWQHLFQASDQTRTATPEGAAAERADVIAFTGFGDPRGFRADEFYRALKEVMRRDGAAALELGDGRGYGPLRTTVAHILASQGVRAQPGDVLITSGSQQALALVAELLLRPGDAVVVENPTYDRALELFRARGVKLVGCPTDAQGMRVEGLEGLLAEHWPKLLYTVPNFQNPTGTCLSLPRRRHLLALARRYDLPVLEDDFAGELRFEGRTLPALKALDPGGQVIYVGTFSKLLMPGLRIGFVVAEGPVLERLGERKQLGDLATSALMQRALENYISVGRYEKQVRRSSGLYRKRRDALLAALVRHLPEARVVPPQGGLFAWVALPENVSAEALLPLARAQGVSYAPGTSFFVDRRGGASFLRLNFAVQTPIAIDEGVRRLRQALLAL